MGKVKRQYAMTEACTRYSKVYQEYDGNND